MNNLAKAILIINAKRGPVINAKKIGWTDAARKKAAMTRKRKSTKRVMSSGKSKPEKKMNFYKARQKAGYGQRLIEDQINRASVIRDKSNVLWKTNQKKSEKMLAKAEKLDAMIKRNELRLKKLVKKYGIDKNPR